MPEKRPPDRTTNRQGRICGNWLRNNAGVQMISVARMRGMSTGISRFPRRFFDGLRAKNMNFRKQSVSGKYSRGRSVFPAQCRKFFNIFRNTWAI
jgi:hypothetical protein